MTYDQMKKYAAGDPAHVPLEKMTDSDILLLARAWPQFAMFLGKDEICRLREIEAANIENAAVDLGFSKIEAMSLSGRNFGRLH